MKKVLSLLLLTSFCMSGWAQRKMESLDRGLTAVKTTKGVFLSWRILGEEYYDVEYNVYRDGKKLNEAPLNVSNFTDEGGSTGSKYTVSAVVRGKEQEQCKEVAPWDKNYMEVKLQNVLSRRGTDITSWYEPNDVSAADLDGDGEMELIVKRLNRKDDADLYPVNNDSAYTQLEAYKLDGTKLWSIDCGPNMVSGSNVETNIVAFDWDEDGKAEVVLRGADGMIVHHKNGTTNVGNMKINTRNTISHTANMTYTNTGDEFLLYLNGETGEPYQVMKYPLERGKADDWGDGYGHRSSKYFFGAPYLDGKKPSIFLARGIYTKHIMAAYDVDPSSHQLNLRWRWNSPLSGQWFGQGYHNYGIADVDWDGRDEIVYGSMVIDDNGHGLSTTGLGHGDAQHCSDLDPYRHGQEIFACNETSPSNNYRDATTSKILFRETGGNDDGRAIAGKFTELYPGAIAASAHSEGIISCVNYKTISGGTKTGIDQNFRIYWDGDLCEETFNYSSCTNNVGYEPRIVKYGSWDAITTFNGALTNNGTKGTASLQADLFGDWREEVVLRDETDMVLRIYTTTIPTEWRNYTLLHDMQYRQGVMWQMCGYNQPPHTSYFLGQLEGITIAPPPIMTNGRTLVGNGGTVDASSNDKHILIYETSDITVNIADGASPYITTINAPSWVQGHDDNDNITTQYFTCTLTGGAFTGEMRLVKQGDGILTLPNVTETYSGETNIWAGTLNFDGTMEKSHVWLNRFTTLNTNGGVFKNGIKMEYGSKLCPGGDNKGNVEVDKLEMDFGSRLVIGIYSEDMTADVVKAESVSLRKIDWNIAPEYTTPIIEFVQHNLEGAEKPAPGKYLIATIGNLSDIDTSIFTIEGLDGVKHHIESDGNNLYLVVEELRSAASTIWTGASSSIWDFAQSENFKNASTQEADIFVTGDNVTFNDEASVFNVTINEEVTPGIFEINSSKDYTFSGNGSISGNAALKKSGEGTLTIKTTNSYTGGNTISGGTVKVSALANQYNATGNLGGVTTEANKFVIENGGTLEATAAVQLSSPIKIGEGGGTIKSNYDFIMDKAFSGDELTKEGNGKLSLHSNGSLKKIIVKSGTLAIATDGISATNNYELQGGILQDYDGNGSYSTSNANVYVPKGKSGTWRLDSRCDYKGALTGEGTLTVYLPWVRCYLKGNWSQFKGTVKATTASGCDFTFDNGYGMPYATLDLSSGVKVTNTAKTFAIAKVTGNGTLGGDNNAWKIGNEDNFRLDATITGNNSSLTKTGEGKMTITANNSYSGSTTVSEGEMSISSGGTLGTGALRVNEGTTLSGVTKTGTPLKNSSATINGDLQVGITATSASGYIEFNNKPVTFGANSTYRIAMRSCATTANTGGTSIKGVSKLTMNGTIKLSLASSYTPKEGDSIRVWECTSFSGTPKFDLEELSGGLEWDTSRISEGLLFIKASTGISNIASDEIVEVTATSINGVTLFTFSTEYSNVEEYFRSSNALPKGIYILSIKHGNARETMKVTK